MNDPSRTPLTLLFIVNSLTVRTQAQQTASKGELLVDLCECYVFGGYVFQCGPM